ncbi:unnamed protein product [Calicophoron daubneyi]|uniref:Uncharacterized protein n=1 Tax=Calicophoron daubneyi TaxID=300641 RepID=A0AAV2THH3_CALDB
MCTLYYLISVLAGLCVRTRACVRLSVCRCFFNVQFLLPDRNVVITGDSDTVGPFQNVLFTSAHATKSIDWFKCMQSVDPSILVELLSLSLSLSPSHTLSV